MQFTFRMPNKLICDKRLQPSVRKVAAVLYAHCNQLGNCHLTVTKIAELAGVSINTVRNATAALEAAGWLTSTQTYKWSAELWRPIYAGKEYMLAPLPKKGWTRIPRDFLSRNAELSSSAFVVCLYLYMAAGNRERRAFPSISKIASIIGVTERTVCRALHQIRCLKDFLVTHCKRTRGDFSSNNYHLCQVLSVAEQATTPAYTKQRTTEPKHEAQVACTTGLRALILRLRDGISKAFSKVRVLTKMINQVTT